GACACPAAVSCAVQRGLGAAHHVVATGTGQEHHTLPTRGRTQGDSCGLCRIRFYSQPCPPRCTRAPRPYLPEFLSAFGGWRAPRIPTLPGGQSISLVHLQRVWQRRTAG